MLSVNKIIPALILYFIQSNSACFSQEIVKTVNPNEQIYLIRTKQFNEFTDRFNYKVNFRGEPIDSQFMEKIPRENMIRALFDQKDQRSVNESKNYSKQFVSDKESFIKKVISDNLQIDKYSDNVIAEAKSLVKYKGAPAKISIFLNQEKVGKSGIKWVITDVHGDIFNFLKTDTTMIRFIPPSSNETDFMNLKRALEDTDYLQYYASSEYSPENLTLFFYLIKSGLLGFEYVEEISYHILDIPGWTIIVREFPRNDMNSGWLISDIKVRNADKTSYIRNLK